MHLQSNVSREERADWKFLNKFLERIQSMVCTICFPRLFPNTVLKKTSFASRILFMDLSYCGFTPTGISSSSLPVALGHQNKEIRWNMSKKAQGKCKNNNFVGFFHHLALNPATLVSEVYSSGVVINSNHIHLYHCYNLQYFFWRRWLSTVKLPQSIEMQKLI